MKWVYLSPHFDDVVYSCGGLVWEQVQHGDTVAIWTVCAGDIPPGALTPYAQSIHTKWQTGPETIAIRRKEDARACRLVGASRHELTTPDCIYRRLPFLGRPSVENETDLFSPLPPAEALLAARLAQEIGQALPRGAQVVAPLGLGGHRDHRLVRLAAESRPVSLGRPPLRYYADYPYAVRPGVELTAQITARLSEQVYPLSPQAVACWKQAVAAYASQLSSFWTDMDEMGIALEAYAQASGGCRMWVNSP